MAVVEAPADLIEAARALAPRVWELRDAIERERRLPAVLVAAMRDAGLYRMWVAHAYGGSETDPWTFIQVVEEIARADGSAAWTLMIGAGSGILSGFLPERAGREIFGTDAHVITGGYLGPGGQAVPVDGGFRVTGRWPFGSGSVDCDWLAGNCVIMDGDVPRLRTDGTPETRLLYFPAADLEIIDTWHVGGLRGTSSHDYAVHDAFVPADRGVVFGAPPVQPGPLFALPIFSALSSGMTGVALGIARAAIDALIALAAEKPRVGGTLLRDRVHTQMQVAEADTCLRAARALIRETAAELWETVVAGRRPDLSLRARTRLAVTHTAATAVRVVDLMYAAAGSSANFVDNPLERALRDIHAAQGHVLFQAGGWETGGRVLLGLPPGTPII